MAAKVTFNTTTSNSRRKLAFIIGINDYDHVTKLTNPEKDAQALSSVLRTIGFRTIEALGEKTRRLEIKKKFDEFEDLIEPNDMVLFYFAGHGIQLENTNYLIPRDCPIIDNIEATEILQILKNKTINAQSILDNISDRGPYVTMFLLDCCRENILLNRNKNKARSIGGNKSNSGGLVAMNKAGSLIAFACAPDTLVDDRAGEENSLFMKHLLKHITRPNEDIGNILRYVIDGVMHESNSKQVPYLSVQLRHNNIYLCEKVDEKVYEFEQIFYNDLEIQEEIGRGAFGIIYKAKWLSRHTIVAVKMLHLTNMTEKIKKTFFKEIAVLQSVRCANIVNFYGACIEEGKYALVMEYISLGSLYKILHEDDTELTWNERLSIALQAAIGINYLHQMPRPILHRDIKSLNLLLERAHKGYNVKICDFGIARTRNETTRQTKSNLTEAVTLQWTAPEILRMESHTDKSDIYSLGIVYWELAACEIPYDGHDDGNIRAFVLAGDRLKIPQSTPSMFRLVIEQCWAQKPNDRPSSSELIQMIEHCITEKDTPKLPLPRSRLKSSKKSELRLESPSRVPTPIVQSSSNRNIPNIPANARWKQNGVTIAGGNGGGDAINQLYLPNGLFVDDDQTVIIADCCNDRIVQCKKGDMNGQVIAGGNGQGNQLDQLNFPMDVWLDKETDSLVITDYINRQVVRWSRRNGTKDGEILIENIDCWGLTMDDQRYLYVSDYEKHEVRRYRLGDKNGTLVAGGNGRGNGLNQLNEPKYLFVDRQQNVYVSDLNNNRVMKWNKGAKEGIVVAGGNGEGNALAQLYWPNGISVDTWGTLYVTDYGNNRVMRWSQGDKQGNVIVGGNGEGAAANQFEGPVGLSFDRQGNLYVVDRDNNRVQRFDILN